MTREETIKALGLMEHVESIVATYEPGERREDTTVRELKEACRMAVVALRAQQSSAKLDRSRWNGCEMCCIDWSTASWAEGWAHDFRVDGDGLFYFDELYGWERIKIKYCPFCGKPLTEEAWAELERRIGGNDGTTD